MKIITTTKEVNDFKLNLDKTENSEKILYSWCPSVVTWYFMGGEVCEPKDIGYRVLYELNDEDDCKISEMKTVVLNTSGFLELNKNSEENSLLFSNAYLAGKMLDRIIKEVWGFRQ